MSSPFGHNADYPFGSARFAEPEEIKRAGYFTREPHSLLVGFFRGYPLWYSGMGGGAAFCGARGGKGTCLIVMNCCAGIHSPSMIILDIKGELAAITRDQTPDRKFCLYWNPHGLLGLPQHRINPLSHLRKDSKTLVSDLKVFIENSLLHSGGANSVFFEGRAKEIVEPVLKTLVDMVGVLTYPALFRAINLLVMGGDQWHDIAFEMSESDNEFIQRVEQEIAGSRSDSTGGIRGIFGEITRAFACLSDPDLMASVSPPFTATIEEIFASDQTYQLYLMPPSDMVESWAPITKSIFVSARTHKARAPAAPRVTFVLDEIGNLGSFPMAMKLFTQDAGIGVRPWGFWQSEAQLKTLAPNAESIIPASAALQNWFSVRDENTASKLSRMIGNETLYYEDKHRQEMTRQARLKAGHALMRGSDPMQAALEIAHQKRLAEIPAVKGRPLLTPDEALGLPSDKQIIFADGLRHPILADRIPYYQLPFMAGRYHPNPYFPTGDFVQVMTPRGEEQWRPVITEPVPPQFAHYPQYADGTWSRIG